MSDDLSYFGISCTLKPSPARSSSVLLLDEIARRLDDAGCTGSTERVTDHDVRFGVTSDEGDGDEWPALRARILEADLFVVTTPIWLGHPSSVCQMVMERLDAFLGEEDDRGRHDLLGRRGDAHDRLPGRVAAPGEDAVDRRHDGAQRRAPRAAPARRAVPRRLSASRQRRTRKSTKRMIRMRTMTPPPIYMV